MSLEVSVDDVNSSQFNYCYIIRSDSNNDVSSGEYVISVDDVENLFCDHIFAPRPVHNSESNPVNEHSNTCRCLINIRTGS